MEGSGTTVAEGGLDLALEAGPEPAAPSVVLESRTLINQETASWVASGSIELLAGSTFINQSSATFNEQTNDVISTDGGVGISPSGLFDNQGTFVVEGGGTATMQASFDNEGQVEINSGTWDLDGVGDLRATSS